MAVWVDRDPATAQIQKLIRRSVRSTVNAIEGFAKVGALPDTVCRDTKVTYGCDIDRVVKRVD